MVSDFGMHVVPKARLHAVEHNNRPRYHPMPRAPLRDSTYCHIMVCRPWLSQTIWVGYNTPGGLQFSSF